MIYLDSRYVDGTLVKIWDARTYTYPLTVFRTWPTYGTEFFWYEWVSGDRLDNLATKYLGDPASWWRILDINPEIHDPLSIDPGTQLRIPNA